MDMRMKLRISKCQEVLFLLILKSSDSINRVEGTQKKTKTLQFY